MTAAPQTFARPRSFLEASLNAMPAADLRCITLPAPAVSPERLLRHDDTPVVLIGRGSNGSSGIGEAVRLMASGANRFRDIQKAADDVFAQMTTRQAPHVPAVSPRFFGGFAFDEGASSSSEWAEFGEASFVMPRWTFTREDENAYLQLVLAPGESSTGVLAECAMLLERLNETPPRQRPASYERVDLEARSAYKERIDRAREAIVRGELRKVVAARHVRLELEQEVRFTQPLLNLADRFPACARFAFRREQSVFLGATPERLVRVEGRHVETEALAGTVPVGHEASLIASKKDAHEHQLVIDAIEDALDPFATLQPVSDLPSVRALPGVLHLHTSIEGELGRDTHILELVEALHPTPAVGGVPRQAAQAWIAEAEPGRGWYASPVGSFDKSGQGEFFVALRCGLIRQREAYAYAGGGIVAGSEASAEYAESELKLNAFLNALGDPTASL